MHLRNRRAVGFLAFLILLTTGLPASSQQPADPSAPGNSATSAQGQEPDSTDTGFVFRKQVSEVALHVTVVDKNRRMVTDLPRDAFKVFENEKPQNITSFRREDIPVAMGIVIDNSGSMREKRERVNKAALNLVRSSNPDDQVFVVNFSDEIYIDQEFTSDINKLKEALEKIEARGGTALYDAVIAAWNDELKTAKLQKKVLLVVTDGEDTASRNSLEQAVETLQVDGGPTIYAIGLLGDEDHPKRAKRALETLADRTGGIAFFPKALDEVDAISRTVAHDIRNQYAVGYKPDTPKSQAGYRTVRVEVKAKGYGKLTARTRSGYYPGQEHEAGGGQ